MAEKLGTRDIFLASLLTTLTPSLTTGCADDTVFVDGDEGTEEPLPIGEAAIGIVPDSPEKPKIQVVDSETGDEISCKIEEGVVPEECMWDVEQGQENCIGEQVVKYCRYQIPIYLSGTNEGFASFGFEIIPSIEGQYLETIEGDRLLSSAINGPAGKLIQNFKEVRWSTLFVLQTPDFQP